MQPQASHHDFKNPKIHSDLIGLYSFFLGVHKNMSKYLRIAILEEEILRPISKMMRLTIQINVMKASAHPPPPQDIIVRLHELRGHGENLKAFSMLLWQARAIGEEYYLSAMMQIETISKQIVGWEKYIHSQVLKK